VSDLDSPPSAETLDGASTVEVRTSASAALIPTIRAVASDLAARVLAPLGELRPKAATRLRETLRAWLDHPGQVQAVAERLHVHPQTVRYRVAQLRELFGDRLDDPDARFELALALRSEPA